MRERERRGERVFASTSRPPAAAEVAARRVASFSHSPRGPRVTPTASASLLMPSCMRLRDSLSKTISLASARAGVWSG
jgi:hypothetical protein